jgi:Ni,Fe-hydrogenase III small subunit
MHIMLLQALFRGPAVTKAPQPEEQMLAELAKELGKQAQRRLGRSLAIRMVDAGSCNGCELEVHALGNPVYDVERFGLKFVASPRHADVLLVTGPVTWNMKKALERTYDAMPEPRWVVALGDCAIDCGVFAGSYACAGPVSAVIPVDLHVSGCPPEPVAILKGLLSLLEATNAS